MAEGGKNMNKVTKKLMTAALSLAMVFSVVTASPVKAEEITSEADVTQEIVTTETNTAETTTEPVSGTATITVEKFTIGQGYLVEPTKIEFKSGDTVASVFEKVMDLKGYTYDANSNWGFFLNSIDNADTGVIDIPAEISALPSYTSSYEYDGQTYTNEYAAPSNEKNDGNSLYEKNGLGSFSYNGMAGWMFTVNNAFAATGADGVEVQDGDVIRFQFSVYGWGADLGKEDTYTTIPAIKLADKTALTKEVGEINAKFNEWMTYTNVSTAYGKAKQTLLKYNPTQEEIDSVLDALQKAKQSPVKPAEETTTPAVTTTQVPTTTYPVVPRATVKSIKNVKKYRAKISVKKLSNVSGYQYRYANNKKFKKAKTKTTKSATFKTKKFKKNQRCYVKIRAYVKVSKTKVFGKWSKVKSVKIKK